MLLRVFLLVIFSAVIDVAIAAPPVVRTQLLGGLLIEKIYTSPATAVAINRSQISAEISARISRINIQVGDIVKAGDVLVTLDCRSYDNALNRAVAVLESLQAQVQLAQQQLQRANALQTAGNLSQDVRDQRVADLDIAKANLKGQSALISDARLSVERCSISAPYRATIIQRLVGEGSLATPGLPLLDIIGLDSVELSAQIPVDLTESVKRSKSLIFVTQNKQLKASIRNLSPVINAATGNRELRLKTNDALNPGTSGRLEWYSLPLLPASLLTRRDGKLGVLMAETSGGKSVSRFIALDAALEGRPAAIDLPAFTRIIVEGRHKLSDGDEISIASDP